ncbi:MAG: cytochrome P450 [Ahrensia sp.]|nr:cytochrome P450 [Ahrensia sp.]
MSAPQPLRNAAGQFVPPYPRRDVPRPTGGKPPPLPLIYWRTLRELPRIISNPLESFVGFQFDMPVSRYRLFSMPFALISDPDLIRHIFVERADALEAEPLRQKVLRPALRDGMLTAEGETWRRARRTIAPVFSPRNVSSFASGMKATTEEFVEDLLTGPQKISVSDAMSRLTYLVLSQTLFSGEIDDDIEDILADVAFFLEKLSAADPLDFLGAPDWVPRPTRFRGGDATSRLRKSVRDAAEDRRARIERGEAVPDDFLTLLLRAGKGEDGALTLDEVEDNIITFIAAGHETTARALGWTLYLLDNDDDARARAEAEADALDTSRPPENWGKDMPWITACFEEAMRLYPPAAVILRRLREPIKFGEYDIPAGVNVYISPWVLHRHTTLWNEPDAFVPQRFFGEARKSVGRFAYLPFGLGPRVCIGASFAMQEAQIILAVLLRRLRFSYVGDRPPWPVLKITVQPDNGMPMRWTARQ